jgi:Domain of unknown function (DUF4375)
MPAIETILAKSSAHEVFWGMQRHIFDTKCGNLEPYESYVRRLSAGEKFTILAYVFIAENTNGGIGQYLSNSSGDYSEDTLEAFEAVGAETAIAALKKIRAEVFSGQAIPQDRQARCDILFEWEERDEAKSAALYREVNDRLGWCESVEFTMAHFMKSNPQLFT